MKKTKIVATIGPASYNEQVLHDMIMEGVDVCRLNFSHGTHEEYRKVIENVRKINKSYNRHTAILADLQGPKLRIGEVENGKIELETGKEIVLTNVKTPGTIKKLYISYPQLPSDTVPGAQILIDDGKIVLEVIDSDGKKEVRTKIIQGGWLTAKKGVNLPDTKISLPCLTQKDLIDLEFALEQEVEWIALSFVRSGEDIKEIKKQIKDRGKTTKVIAKIEKPQALHDIDAILKEADGLMVARGDLGVEIPLQDVPIIQKQLVIKCREASKPVIIATQMMESMIDNITPTRAEVNDVANAVMDGADAVMLSAETSLGNHPVEVIKMFNKIIKKSETFGGIYYHYNTPDPNNKRFISDSICYNATKLAERVEAKAIITMSFSGYTGHKISSFRPNANTFIFTANRSILNSLSLIWGVKGYFYNKFISTDDTILDIIDILKKEDAIKTGDLIINIASIPISDKGESNMLKLSRVK